MMFVCDEKGIREEGVFYLILYNLKLKLFHLDQLILQ